MSAAYVLPLDDPDATLSRVGGKGASLARLARTGLPVPDGFHITTAAYREFVDDNDLQAPIQQALQNTDISNPATLEAASHAIAGRFAQATIPAPITDAIVQAYGELEGQDPPVAIRSSATAEDLPEASFAGQQETYLNVRSTEGVLEAVKKCWASLWTTRAIGYRIRQGIDQDAVSLAVVVQILVPAEAAGVIFTANPMNGRRDQFVINASWGLGESIVGGTVTPDTIIVDKASGRAVERQISDKQSMTVPTPQGTGERPVPDALRRTPVLDDEQTAELARLGTRIELLYGTLMDIEWALADGAFSILQARPITALPEPEAEPPAEWKRPDPKALCYRASIVELLPDPLTPLFATLGGRAINASSLQLFSSVLGPGAMSSEIFVTINGYAYYQMRLTPKFWWGALVKIWPFLPQFLRGEARWRDEARPRYLAVIERWQSRPLSEYTATELLEGAYQIVAEAANIYTVYQSGVVVLAMGAEMLFTAFYKLIRRAGDPPALTFLVGGDSTPILAEKSLYNVAQWCRERGKLAEYVARTPGEQLAALLKSDAPPPGVAADKWHELARRFQAHLTQYGHLVYDLDFGKPVPADDPAPLLEALRLYLADPSMDPHHRQQAQIARREKAARKVSKRLKGLRLKWFRKLLGWAQKYVPMREDPLADIGLGYPLLRQMLRELGERLARAGMLEQPDEVYWLYEAEAREAAAALDRGEQLGCMSETIRHRQAQWRAARRVAPPIGLPERSGMTKFVEKVGPARVASEEGNTIRGVGVSPGSVTARACVLHGPDDFNRMQPGGVLVAAITTPAWTPLFAMASAVVTDTGGPLSHGSIVAREYGIPAVLGTGLATRRIRHGQVITVDGDAGTVTLVDTHEAVSDTK